MSLLFDIPLGNHVELFTYGLNPSVAPPVPPSTDTRVKSLGQNQTGYSFNGENSAPNTGGQVFAVGPRTKQIEWAYYFGSTPSSATLVLQASLDGTHFWTVDSSFAFSDVRRVRTGAAFYRIGTGGVDAGIPLFGTITAKP